MNLDLPELIGPTMRALQGILLGSMFYSILYRFQLFFHNVELRVGDDEYLGVHVAFSIKNSDNMCGNESFTNVVM